MRDGRASALAAWLVEQVAAKTGAPADARSPLRELGLDSLGAVAITVALSERVGLVLPATFFWEHPTIEVAVAALTGESATAVVAAAPGVSEPIAIVGMACRVPGAGDRRSFWRLVADGVDAVGTVPPGRWNADVLAALDEAELARVRRGAFLDAVDGFDGDFFGIRPSEAVAMDPQQRLLLELTWEALQDAGLPPSSLMGSAVGVYIGAIWQDYDAILARSTTPPGPWTATGSHRSVLANRISYLLGLRGPSLAIDSACSSSLVAVHFALQSLRSGGCTAAIVGGVSLNLLAESAIATMQLGALSPTGRCHTFDHRADGYVRGEGGGVLVLRTLSSAIADGLPILALIRGAAVNNDGASNGLTAPNPAAQVDVLRAAWADAGVAPEQVRLIEAHGTGTPLGDPIEAGALRAVFGALYVGSVKTQIGHLEGAAGVAGLARAALSLHHGLIPPNLNFEEFNPDVDSEGLTVATAAVPWPEGPRFAGVSSFGFGGTNAHVALEGWARYARPVPAVPSGVDTSAGVVFVFPGQGGQWAGMARTLLQREPVFRASLARCSEVAERWLGWSILRRIAFAEAEEYDPTATAMPCTVAVSIALTDWWRAAGLVPTACIGTSSGEIASAYAAGALDLAGAMQVACATGTTYGRREGEGALAWVGRPWGSFEAADGVWPIIEDGPGSTVVGGRADAVRAWSAAALAEGVDVRPIAVRVSPHVPDEAVAAELAAALSALRSRRPTVPMIDGRSGDWVEGPTDPAFWVDAMTSPVRVASGLRRLVDAGHRVFVEVGPHPLTRRAIEAVLAGCPGVALASLRRGEDDRLVLASCAAALVALGFPAGGADPATPVRRDGPVVLALSAKSDRALRQSAGALATELADAALVDVAHTLAVGRDRYARRAALVAGSAGEAARALAAFASDGHAPQVMTGTGATPRVIFVFPGQGSQWVGMGRALLADDLAFADAFAACDEAVTAVDGPDLRAALDADDAAAAGEVGVIQPLLFAVQVALAAAWRARGVVPDGVVGHSMGEVAAAVVAGRLSLADGARVIVRRSALLRRICGRGAMALVELAVDEAEAALAGSSMVVAVANAPRSVVVAGGEAEVAALLDRLGAEGVFCRRVHVDVASHSPQVDPLLHELRACLADLRPLAGEVPFHSTVDTASDGPLDAEYWSRNLRSRVRFCEVIAALPGSTVFVEISPHPVLTTAVRETSPDATVVPSLRRDVGVLRDAEAALWAAGVGVRLTNPPGQIVPLPVVWLRERYWPTPAARRAAPGRHPWLLSPLTPADRPGVRCWPVEVDVEGVGAVAQHAIGPQVVLPGAGAVELFLAALRDRDQPLALADVVFERPVRLGGVASLQVMRSEASLTLFAPDGDGWLAAARARAGTLSGPEVWAAPRCPEVMSVAAHQARLARSGLVVGPAYQAISALHVGPEGAEGEVVLRPEAGPSAGFVLPPSLLDAALQVALAVTPEVDAVLVPASIRRLVVWRSCPTRLRVSARRVGADVDLVLRDAEDRVVACVDGLRLARLDVAALAGAELPSFRTAWRPIPPAAARPPGTWVLWTDRGGVGSAIAAQLRQRGGRVISLRTGAWERTGPDDVRLDPRQPEQALAVLRDLGPVQGVVTLAALDAPEDDAGVVEVLSGALSLAQAALATAGRDTARLVAVTRGAVCAGGVPWQAPLWGFVRVAQLEQPELAARCVDLDPAAVDVVALADALLDAGPEDNVALRDGRRLGARLVSAPLAAVTAPVLRSDATWLITGGLGGLGLSAASWLAERGVRQLVLVGRSGPSAAALAEISHITTLGAAVEVRSVDVARADEVEALIRSIRHLPPLRGVIHAAGVLVDATIPSLQPGALAPALAPKVAGAWNLHRATLGCELDAFVLYGSAAAVLGSPGQANYAAANSFVAALAEARAAMGLPALCLEWGAFADIGLAAARSDRGGRLALGGVGSWTPAEGLDLLGRALRGQAAVVAPIRLSSRRWKDTWPVASSSPLLSELVDEPEAPRAAGVLAALVASPVARTDTLRAWLVGRLAELLRQPESDINGDAPLRDLGVDSLMSLEVRNRLEVELHTRLPASLLFTFPTVDALVGHLLERLFPPQETPALAAPAEAPVGETPAPSSVDDAPVEPGWTKVEAELARRLAAMEAYLA